MPTETKTDRHMIEFTGAELAILDQLVARGAGDLLGGNLAQATRMITTMILAEVVTKNPDAMGSLLKKIRAAVGY